MTLEQAIQAVIDQAPDSYAKAYARAGLGMTGEALRTQCLYILSNTQSWRGPLAREAKAILREASK